MSIHNSHANQLKEFSFTIRHLVHNTIQALHFIHFTKHLFLKTQKVGKWYQQSTIMESCNKNHQQKTSSNFFQLILHHLGGCRLELRTSVMNLNILKGILWDESHFPRIFQCSNSFPHVFPVFTWFSHDFPMFFQWVSNCFLTMFFFAWFFQWFSDAFTCFHMRFFLSFPSSERFQAPSWKFACATLARPGSLNLVDVVDCLFHFLYQFIVWYCFIMASLKWTWMSWVKGLLNYMKSHEQTFDMKWDVMIDSDSAKKHQHSCLFNHVWSMLHHVLPRAHACKLTLQVVKVNWWNETFTTFFLGSVYGPNEWNQTSMVWSVRNEGSWIWMESPDSIPSGFFNSWTSLLSFFLPSKNTTNTIIDPVDLFFFIHVFFGEHDSWKHLGLLGSACLPAVGGRKDTMAVML